MVGIFKINGIKFLQMIPQNSFNIASVNFIILLLCTWLNTSEVQKNI